MTTRYVSRVAMFVLVVKILSLFVSVHITLSMWSSADATLTSINSTKRILFFVLLMLTGYSALYSKVSCIASSKHIMVAIVSG